MISYGAYLKRHKYFFLVLLVLAAVLSVSYFASSYFDFLSDRESIAAYARSYGIWAPLIIIALIAGEVVIAPLPGYALSVISGILFGPVEGGAYAVIGNVVGSSIAFWISRRFGKDLALRFISERKLAKYEEEINHHRYFFWFFYFVPVFPTDILSFVFGLSAIPFKRFISIVTPGFIFNIAILNFSGNTILGYLGVY